MTDLSKPQRDRLQKREQLLQEGVEVYKHKAIVGELDAIETIVDDYGHLEPNTTTTDVFRVAGRIMFKRSSGKIAFATLQAGEGTTIQLMFMANEIGSELLTPNHRLSQEEAAVEAVRLGKAELKRFDKTVDLGDFIYLTGHVATTIAGELSLKVDQWELLSKGTRPLPFLHAELSEETRVRQPYAELLQSQEARDRVRQRASIIRALRYCLEDAGYVEVETPIIQPVHGGALARPFKTHVNALHQDFSLRIALELPLKKAVVGGLENVFEIGKVFRNEGMDSTHSPEYTMLEAYEAYGDMHTMAYQAQELIESSAATLREAFPQWEEPKWLEEHEDAWRWLDVYQAVSDLMGQEVTPATPVGVFRTFYAAEEFGKEEWDASTWVMELVSEFVEPTLFYPTFLHGWPEAAQPLACRDGAGKVLAWDLIVNGMEVATAFSELIDPVVQREVLTQQSLAAAGGDPEAMELDEDFLRALEYGAPPMGGLGLGVDRLVMLLTDCNIRQAILFPLLKREEF